MNKIISIVNNIKELNYLTLDLKRSYIINYTNVLNNKYDIIFVNIKLPIAEAMKFLTEPFISKW